MFRPKPQPLEDAPSQFLSVSTAIRTFSVERAKAIKKSLTKALADRWSKKEEPIDPQVLQQAILTDIGQRLQVARTEKHRTLDDISQQTQIPPRILDAIEAGDRDRLPEPVYIRAAIKQFADALGLDGQAISHELPVVGVGTKEAATPARRSQIFLQVRPVYFYLFYLVLVVLSVRGISNFLKQSVLEASRVDLPPEPLPAIVSSPPLPAKPAVSPAPAPAKAIAPGVAVELKDASWVRVMVDNKVAFEGMLSKGDRRTWQAGKQVTIRAGNAGGVWVQVNDSPAKAMGEVGRVEEMTYTIAPRS